MQKHLFHTPAKHGHMLNGTLNIELGRDLPSCGISSRIFLKFREVVSELCCDPNYNPYVPSWYETDGEGCTPLMPLCKVVFLLWFCHLWALTETHTTTIGTDSYHFWWAQGDKNACTAPHMDCLLRGIELSRFSCACRKGQDLPPLLLFSLLFAGACC